MQIFHIATESDWAQAQASGFYLTSSRGRTLQEEGFIHASRADQWEQVRTRFYADATEPLVLLLIDTDLLTSPWREDPVTLPDGGQDSFPHIYGPLNPSAVTGTVPLGASHPTTPIATASSMVRPSTESTATASVPTSPPGTSLRNEMYREVFFKLSLVLLVMLCTVIGGSLGQPPILGAGIGALVGVVLAVVGSRLFAISRDKRLGAPPADKPTSSGPGD